MYKNGELLFSIFIKRKIPECYIRGNSIKYLRIPDEVMSMVPDDSHESKFIFNIAYVFAILLIRLSCVLDN